ncbi:MAG: glycosyltransferase 61 family protein, partial [Thermodesulfobacteriota bacterium]
ENRPDLVIETLPCPPTGLTVVRGLDPTSRFLSKHLEKMCGRYRSLDYSVIEQQKKQKLNLIDMNEGIVGAFDKGAFLKSRYKAMMFLPFQINHRTREKFSIKTDRSEHRFYGFDSMEPYSEILQLKKTTPGFVRRDDAIYFPSQNDPPIDSESGLCDGGGNVIMESCLFRGQDSSEKVTELKCFVGVTERRRLEGNYIYGGFLDPHYGHFLTETMGRLWILLNEPQAGSFLLFHGDLSTLKLDFVKTILDFLPIENDKIIVLDHVVELEKVTIPLPSMVNRGAIHTIHKKLPVEVAQKFIGSQNFRRTEQPLYLSRRKLSKNIRHIQNEHVFEKYLESKNVKIVYPEELPFAEQVLLFNRHKVVIGPFGSAHHTSMFSLKPLTAVYLCHPGTLSNYLMTDYISHSSSHYILCCQVDLQYKRPLYLSSQILDVDYALSCLKRIGIV